MGHILNFDEKNTILYYFNANIDSKLNQKVINYARIGIYSIIN